MASKQLISAKKPHDCLSNEIWNFSSSYAPFFFLRTPIIFYPFSFLRIFSNYSTTVNAAIINREYVQIMFRYNIDVRNVIFEDSYLLF